MRRKVRSAVLCSFTTLALAAPAAAQHTTPGTFPGTSSGPSSSDTPYAVPKTGNGWESISIITTGDAAKDNLYQMVGVPDGLGALAGRYDEDEQTYVADKAFMTVFMNHELLATEGSGRSS